MNQYENLSLEQANDVMKMMISEQKRVRFEMDRKKRIKQLQTLPKNWNTFLVIAGFMVIGIGVLLEIRIIGIILPILILYSVSHFSWRYRTRHLVNSVRNERFEP
jgi:uncharacterized membrane protein